MTKRKPKSEHKPSGRPEAITPEVLTKLEHGFMNSLTDEECCLYADISPVTLYRYIEKHPNFGKRKEILKKKPNIKAKLNWLKKINEQDYQASKEWLERKSRDEFSLKTETDNNTKIEIEGNISIRDAESMSEYERNELRKAIISGEKL